MNEPMTPADRGAKGLTPAKSLLRRKTKRRGGQVAGGRTAGRGACSCRPAAKEPVRCASYATRSDIVSGIAGGLGLLSLSAAVLDVEVVRYFRDALHEGERLSFSYGLGAVRAAALDSRFSLLIVSSPCSLGSTLGEASATLRLLASHGVEVFAGCRGYVDLQDLELFYAAPT